MNLPDLSLPWPINRPGLVLVSEREGCELRSYRKFKDEPWTCGWGETDGVGPDTQWTQQYADQRFCDSLTFYASEVRALLTVEANENEFAAMVILAYNIGLGWKGKTKPKGAKDGFRQSTVLRQHNAGRHDAAANAFRLWNQVAGQVVRGLTSRRLAEAALYTTPPPGAAPHPMPQAVEPESKLTTSPIAQAGTVTAGAGVVGVLAQLGDQVTAVKGVLASVKAVVVDTLGVPPDWVLPVLAIAVGVVIVRYRRLQRLEGHA